MKRRLRVCAQPRPEASSAPHRPSASQRPPRALGAHSARGAAVHHGGCSSPPLAVPPSASDSHGALRAWGGRDYNSQHAAARLAATRHAGSRSPEHRPPLPAARLETPCGAEGSSFGAPPFREQVGEARGAARLRHADLREDPDGENHHPRGQAAPPAPRTPRRCGCGGPDGGGVPQMAASPAARGGEARVRGCLTAPLLCLLTG